MKNKLNFVTFFDEDFYELFLIHYSSILDNYSDTEFCYWIGTDENTQKRILDLELKGTKVINIEQNVDDEFSNYSMIQDRISKFTMSRLKMFDYFPELNFEENIVYLDVDTIFNGRFEKSLFNKKNQAVLEIRENNVFFDDILNYWFLKKIDDDLKARIIKLFIKENYFNAGILIINDKKRIKQLFKKALNSPYKVDDQTLLNFYNKNEIDILKDDTYNCIIKYNFSDSKIIYHLAGYEKYTNLSDFRNIDNFEYLNKLKNIKYFEFLEKNNGPNTFMEED